MDEVTKKMNAEVVAVFPNKIKISVDDLSEFIIAEEKLRVGSYLEVSDNENAVMIAIVENYAIEVQNDGNRKYIIEVVPLGTLSDGKFNRGGDSLAIPPKEVKPATKEQITQIY
ncbi:MAG TPA: Bipolar DNA helicase, partial [Thermoanaerobacterales bacterium]|nr:Bipolar DNA helicase [Thermoanaerobacterales bacterium]